MERSSEKIRGLENALRGAAGDERLDLLAKLAGAIGDSDPAESMFLAGQVLSQGTGDDGETPRPGAEGAVASALLTSAIALARQSDYARAFERASRSRGIYESRGDESGVADAIRAHGNVHLLRGEYREARGPLEEALRAYRRARDLEGCSKCVLSLGAVGLMLGDMRTAERLFTFALRLERRAPDPEVRGKALYNLTEVRRDRGEVVELVGSLLECLEIFGETGDREGLIAGHLALGQAYVTLHRYTTAREHVEKSLSIAREVGRPHHEVNALTELAELDIAIGRSESSLARARDALRIASDLDDRQTRASALRALGSILRRLGKLAEARASLEAALEMERAEGIRRNEVKCLEELGEVHLDRGDFDVALSVLGEAKEICREIGHGRMHAEVLLALGRAHLARDDPATARSTLEAGLSLARQQGARHVEVRLHRQLADACRDLGDHRHGLDHMTRFHDLECELRGGEYEDLLDSLVSVQEVERTLREAESQRELNDRLQALNAELRKANLDLSRANHAKTEMFGIMIHDLRDPLTAVLGYSTLGEREAEGRSRKLFGHIRGAVERASEIIQSLVGAQQLEAGQLTLLDEPVDLYELAAEAATEFGPIASAKGISLSVHELPHAGHATGDGRACRTVLDNLVSNAVKFGSEGDRVEILVGAGEEGPRARVRVRDTGPGIPEEEQDQLFTKFARLSPRPTANEISTGLGLYSVRLLVTAMQGEVACESGVGRGSTFTMELPAAG
ncbi:MAG: tetratricopeptide repeat protein [Planctomycetota bacterium]